MKKVIDQIYVFVINHKKDVLVCIILGVLCSSSYFYCGQMIPKIIFDSGRMDLWFHADPDRLSHNMTVLGVGQSVIAFMWSTLLFVILRLIGCRRADAMIFSLLAAVSAAAVFWFTVPAIFGLASTTVLFALFVLVLSHSHALSPLWYIAVNIATLSVAATNWMAGIVITALAQPRRHAIQHIAIGFAVVMTLWVIQKYIFPAAVVPLGDQEGSMDAVKSLIGNFTNAFQSFCYHSLIMPEIQMRNLMTTQGSMPGSGGWWGMYAVILWTALLILGGWALFKLKRFLKFRIGLGLILLGQLSLCRIHGEETFLYSLYFIVLLVPLAALGTLTRIRNLVVALVLILIPCVVLNNAVQFKRAKDFLNRKSSSVELVVK